MMVVIFLTNDLEKSTVDINISKPTCMVKFVGSDRGKLCTKFIDNKIVSFVLIPVTKNNWMSKVHSTR
jgi:hypothetical protein